MFKVNNKNTRTMLITSTLTFTCSNSTIVTPYLSVFSPNAGKYGPEKTRYLDTFHAVIIPPTLLRKTLQHRCVLVKFAKSLRTTSFTEHFRFLFIRGTCLVVAFLYGPFCIYRLALLKT